MLNTPQHDLKGRKPEQSEWLLAEGGAKRNPRYRDTPHDAFEKRENRLPWRQTFASFSFLLCIWSRGLSVSATPGMPSSSRKASERRENSRQGSRFSRSSRILVGVMIPRVTLRSTLGYEPLALLGHSTFQVVLSVIARRLIE